MDGMDSTLMQTMSMTLLSFNPYNLILALFPFQGITRMPSEIDQVASMLSKSSVEDVNLVSFAGRKLKVDTAEDAKEIVDAIKSTVDITALRLEGNTIGLEAAIEIAEALKNQGKFEKALWSDIFTGRL